MGASLHHLHLWVDNSVQNAECQKVVHVQIFEWAFRLLKLVDFGFLELHKESDGGSILKDIDLSIIPFKQLKCVHFLPSVDLNLGGSPKHEELEPSPLTILPITLPNLVNLAFLCTKPLNFLGCLYLPNLESLSIQSGTADFPVKCKILEEFLADPNAHRQTSISLTWSFHQRKLSKSICFPVSVIYHMSVLCQWPQPKTFCFILAI
ncbi:hypothetical protein CPB84DRAFT_382853 [Gymnopilus junonius]|uniref:Uncharacterized protein n=1 Tax=Gymnopilus junonius TaxID=109634 RepID=A0A9P5NCN1_GYMJU|nr:hypothetical protein CPB84DRAFT_382853 [Gymnopilus junonius]